MFRQCLRDGERARQAAGGWELAVLCLLCSSMDAGVSTRRDDEGLELGVR